MGQIRVAILVGVFAAPLLSSAQQAINWGAKNTTLAVAERTAGFRVLKLSQKSFQLRSVDIVWVQAHAGASLPARKAVRLEYGTKEGSLYVVEARTLPGISSRSNTWWVVSQGYFKFPKSFSLDAPTITLFGSNRGTDVYVLGSAKPAKLALEQLLKK